MYKCKFLCIQMLPAEPRGPRAAQWNPRDAQQLAEIIINPENLTRARQVNWNRVTGLYVTTILGEEPTAERLRVVKSGIRQWFRRGPQKELRDAVRAERPEVRQLQFWQWTRKRQRQQEAAAAAAAAAAAEEAARNEEITQEELERAAERMVNVRLFYVYRIRSNTVISPRPLRDETWYFEPFLLINEQDDQDVDWQAIALRLGQPENVRVYDPESEDWARVTDPRILKQKLFEVLPQAFQPSAQDEGLRTQSFTQIATGGPVRYAYARQEGEEGELMDLPLGQPSQFSRLLTYLNVSPLRLLRGCTSPFLEPRPFDSQDNMWTMVAWHLGARYTNRVRELRRSIRDQINRQSREHVQAWWRSHSRLFVNDETGAVVQNQDGGTFLNSNYNRRLLSPEDLRALFQMFIPSKLRTITEEIVERSGGLRWTRPYKLEGEGIPYPDRVYISDGTLAGLNAFYLCHLKIFSRRGPLDPRISFRRVKVLLKPGSDQLYTSSSGRVRLTESTVVSGWIPRLTFGPESIGKRISVHSGDQDVIVTITRRAPNQTPGEYKMFIQPPINGRNYLDFWRPDSFWRVNDDGTMAVNANITDYTFVPEQGAPAFPDEGVQDALRRVINQNNQLRQGAEVLQAATSYAAEELEEFEEAVGESAVDRARRLDQMLRDEKRRQLCPICQINRKNTLLACGHRICSQCLNTLVERGNPQCPICRRGIVSAQARHMFDAFEKLTLKF